MAGKNKTGEVSVAPGIDATVETGKGGKVKTILLEIDVSGKGTLSGSGKNIVLASTRGNRGIPDTDLIIGLNIYRPKD